MYQNYFNSVPPMVTSGQFPNQYSSTMRQEIVKVNGESGAKAYQLAPNSTALLLDVNEPLVWYVQTDGAGYKTVSCYNITPVQSTPAVDLNSLNDRISKLEAIISESDYFANERKGDKPAASNADVAAAKRNK